MLRSAPLLFLAVLTVATVGLMGAARLAGAHPRIDQAAPVRIGVYDSRAVGLAYGRSKAAQQEIAALVAEHRKAKETGDAGRVKELEKKGASRQIRMHLQVFSNAPVDDALESVRAELPGLAQRTGVVAIASALAHREPGVETVDISDDLVTLFDPTPDTLKAIAEMRRTKPAPIEQVAQIPAKN